VGVRQADRPRVAALANVSHRSSTFDANISALKGQGLVSYPSKGVLSLTDQGGLRAHVIHAPLTTDALQEAILHKLDPYPREILRALIGRYPEPAGREDIAQEINVSAKSSTFDASISTLKAFGFLEYPERGVVRATDLLFLGGQ
jgi:Mn-dependent DtxR family transcriptional regulator